MVTIMTNSGPGTVINTFYNDFFDTTIPPSVYVEDPCQPGIDNVTTGSYKVS